MNFLTSFGLVIGVVVLALFLSRFFASRLFRSLDLPTHETKRCIFYGYNAAEIAADLVKKQFPQYMFSFNIKSCNSSNEEKQLENFYELTLNNGAPMKLVDDLRVLSYLLGIKDTLEICNKLK